MKIAKHTFFVTGGASGLGQAVVEKIVAENGNVVIADLNEKDGEELVKKLGADKALFVKMNVVDEKSVAAALDATVKKFGGLHGVVQCAGVGTPCRVLSSKGTVHSLKQFDLVVQINLIGTFNVLRLATAIMAKQEAEDGERGVFIHVASVAAFEGQIGQAAYAASKGGVVAMTLPIARELAALGIRVNTVAPGLFRTPMMAALPQKAQDSLAQQVPFPRRLGAPAEFASLCSEMITNQYINGTVVRIDGSIRMSAM